MGNQFKQIATLIGDPVRATIMWTLMDGRAFTATELAVTANTSPQNISMHLAKLTGAGLLCVESQGRHRYYKFARKDIAYGVEAMANLIPPTATGKNILAENISPIKYCRTCYDHLAGKVGVMITDSMLRQKIIIDKNNVFEIGVKGLKWFSNLDINTNDLKQERRFFIRPCLDWSERRHHMAGSLAASLLDKMLSADWIRRTKNSRAIIITAKGQKMLYEYFRISL
jgi:DNA-binding transcriptional ArsR family regulator